MVQAPGTSTLLASTLQDFCPSGVHFVSRRLTGTSGSRVVPSSCRWVGRCVVLESVSGRGEYLGFPQTSGHGIRALLLSVVSLRMNPASGCRPRTCRSGPGGGRGCRVVFTSMEGPVRGTSRVGTTDFSPRQGVTVPGGHGHPLYSVREQTGPRNLEDVTVCRRQPIGLLDLPLYCLFRK